MQLNISKVLVGSLALVGMISGAMAQGRPVREIEKKIEKREIEKKEIETGVRKSGETRAIEGSAPLSTRVEGLPASGSVTSKALEAPSVEKLGAVCGITGQAAGQQATDIMSGASDAETAAFVQQVTTKAQQLEALEGQLGIQSDVAGRVSSATAGIRSLKGDSEALQGAMIAFDAQIEASQKVLAEKKAEVAACQAGAASACKLLLDARDNDGVLAKLPKDERDAFKNNCMTSMGLRKAG